MVVRSKTGWSGGRELGKASSSFYSHLSIKAGFCVYPSWQTEGRKERRGSQAGCLSVSTPVVMGEVNTAKERSCCWYSQSKNV